MEAGSTSLPTDQTAPTKPVRLTSSRAQRPKSIYDFTLSDLETQLEGVGAPRYRARQLYNWLYSQLVPSYDVMNNLPGQLRQQLGAELPIAVMTPIREIATDGGDTFKTLYRTADNQFVETVLMLYPDR